MADRANAKGATTPAVSRGDDNARTISSAECRFVIVGAHRMVCSLKCGGLNDVVVHSEPG